MLPKIDVPALLGKVMWDTEEKAMKTKTVGAFAHIANEKGEVLCVKQNYSNREWTQAGGGVEEGEDPRDAVVREVFEETGLVVEVVAFIGVYTATYKDDVVFFFEAKAKTFTLNPPNSEIADLGFYAPDKLPEPFTPNARLRLKDGIEGKRGVYRVLESRGVFKN
jgi:8-oxo-dGTP diphosphatase